MELQGLSRDTRPHEQPKGSYPYAKNGIIDERGIHKNELGLLPSNATIPYQFIGSVPTPKYPIIVSSNGTNTAIGYFDLDNDAYIPILNDATLPYKIPFSPAHYVTGQAQLNYKGEVIAVLTDNNTFPILINCDNPQANSLNDLRFFPLFNSGVVAVEQEDGGTLIPGAYFIAFQYVKNDGTETAYTGISGPYLISGTPNISSGKAFRLYFSELDENYDRLRISIISKIEGKFIAQTLIAETDIGTGGKTVAVISGSDPSDTALVEEILEPPVRYTRVKTFGRFNDSLYAGNVSIDPAIDMQAVTNMVKVTWVSELIDVLPPPAFHLNGTRKSFLHREVYALVIQYSKIGGGWTPFYPLIGPKPLPAHLDPSGEASGEGISAKVFQVEDTIQSFDAANFRGTCGIWQNQDETYPDIPSFDSTSLGGENLRGQPVRHFRLPSIRWCKENLYASEASYGKDKLDLLGLEISNVVIPANLQNVLDGGYRIAYARRSVQNSTVVGQGLFLQAARSSSNVTGLPDSADNNYISTGGNWGAVIDWDGSSREKPLRIDPSLFRFHSFDLLYNKPSITPAFIGTELKLRRTNIPYSGGLLEDYSVTPGTKNGPIMYLIDYAEKGLSPLPAVSGKRIRKITESRYVPNNLVVGKWKNLQQESTFGGKISGSALLDSGELSEHIVWTGPSTQRKDKAVQFETTYLCNMMNLPDNLYLPFNSQSLVFAGNRQTSIGTFWGGDAFLCDYSFHTYGWNDSKNDDYGLGTDNAPLGGIRTARRFICESVSNINARFETIGNIYSKWYPSFPLIPDDPSNYMLFFDRANDCNQFGYSRDLNTVNDLNPYTVFNALREYVKDFPFRIHRCGKLSKQTKIRSWRTILPLDYYEMEKNMGEVVNLEGQHDKLLIHCLKALFITRDKAKLEAGNLSVVLGSGDIFQFEPQPGMSSKLGYAGTQHQIACIQTPIGYIFVDDNLKQVFLLKGDLKMLNESMNIFFRTAMDIKEDNIFTGNGYTIGYDELFKRILLTAKNQKLPANVRTNFVLSADTIGDLVIGDIIYRYGRYVQFDGINTTPYDCIANIVPIVTDHTFSIPETTAINTDLLDLNDYASDFVSMSLDPYPGNTNDKFSLQTISGHVHLILAQSLDYETATSHLLKINVTSIDGETVQLEITVNVTDVVEAPGTGSYIFDIDENVPNGTLVGIVDIPGTTSYAITGGNPGSTFVINPVTGQLAIGSNFLLDHEINPVFDLIVAASNGGGSSNISVHINVIDVNEAPEVNDDSVTIYEDTAIDTVIYEVTAVDPESNPLTYTIIGTTGPGLFDIEALTGKVKVAGTLDASIASIYTLTIRVQDGLGAYTDMNLAINLQYNPMSVHFEPAAGFCTLTTRNWLYVDVKKGSTLIIRLNNVSGQTWQGLRVPDYPPITNSTECGGAITAYYSVTKFGTAIKDDCVTGTGSLETYVVPAGSYRSTIDQSNADALAQVDVNTNKQAWANSQGYCVR